MKVAQRQVESKIEAKFGTFCPPQIMGAMGKMFGRSAFEITGPVKKTKSTAPKYKYFFLRAA